MDIVERLRNSPCSGDIGCAQVLCNEAAEKIKKLRVENDKQREIIILLQSKLQTEPKIIFVRQASALNEGE